MNGRCSERATLGGGRELAMIAISISKKLNIPSSTASELAMRGRQMFAAHRW